MSPDTESTSVPLDLYYREGNKALRDTARLRHRTRSLAIITTGVTLVVVAAPYVIHQDGPEVGALLRPGAVVLAVIAFAFGFIDWHHRLASEPISDRLAQIEAGWGERGPWFDQVRARSTGWAVAASQAPFALILGLAALLAGADVGWSSGELRVELSWWVLFILPAGAIGIVRLGRREADARAARANKIEQELAAAQASH